MNFQFNFSVDEQTLIIIGLLLVIFGTVFERGISWVYRKLPPDEQVLCYLLGSAIGQGGTILLLIPIIGAVNAFVIFAGLFLSGVPIAIGVLVRYFRPRAQLPRLGRGTGD